jgi:xanthine dehydrogenase molybdopterin-binding subunit B
MSYPVTVEKFAIGQSVRRVEDTRLLQGFGRYSDDVNLPQQAYAVVVRSPHAHAGIRSIDTTAARNAAGVLPCSPAPISRPTGSATCRPTSRKRRDGCRRSRHHGRR